MRFQTLLAAALVSGAMAAPAPDPQGDWTPPGGYKGVFNRRDVEAKRQAEYRPKEFRIVTRDEQENEKRQVEYRPAVFRIITRDEQGNEKRDGIYPPALFRANKEEKRGDGPPHYGRPSFNVGKAEKRVAPPNYGIKFLLKEEEDTNEKRVAPPNYGNKFILAEGSNEKRVAPPNYGNRFILAEGSDEKQVPPDYDTRFHPIGKAE